MIGRCSETGEPCQVNPDCPGTQTCQNPQQPLATTSATVTYTPNTGDNKEDSFTFTVTDSGGEVSLPGTVRINPVGDPTDPPPRGDAR